MARSVSAEFEVPQDTGGLGQGQWIWTLAEIPGLKQCALDSLFGVLEVEGTKKAVDQVREFCRNNGFPEVRPE